MPPPSPHTESLKRMLAELLGVEPSAVAELVTDERSRAEGVQIFAARRIQFVLKAISSSTTARVDAAAKALTRVAREQSRSSIAVLVVPFAGRAARQAAERARVGLIDLAGNASIRSGSVFIHVEGRPDPAPLRGRPRDAFAPRARRIVSVLVAHGTTPITQRALAQEASLDEGRTSRVIRALVDDGLVVRDEDRRVRVRDRALLVDAYRDSRPIDRATRLSFNLVARSNDARLRALRELLEQESIDYAATASLGARALLHLPQSDPLVLYVATEPSPGGAALIGLRRAEGRADIALVFPSDPWVLERRVLLNGLYVAPPLDVYADLVCERGADETLLSSLRERVLS